MMYPATHLCLGLNKNATKMCKIYMIRTYFLATAILYFIVTLLRAFVGVVERQNTRKKGPLSNKVSHKIRNDTFFNQGLSWIQRLEESLWRLAIMNLYQIKIVPMVCKKTSIIVVFAGKSCLDCNPLRNYTNFPAECKYVSKALQAYRVSSNLWYQFA